MKKIVFFMVLACFAASNFSVYADVQEAGGSQTLGSALEGTGLNSDAIKVEEGGIIIIDYKVDCVKSVWLEKQNEGYRSIFKKFYDLEGLKDLIIEEPGTYYIYPVPGEGCQRASVSIKYENLNK